MGALEEPQRKFALVKYSMIKGVIHWLVFFNASGYESDVARKIYDSNQSLEKKRIKLRLKKLTHYDQCIELYEI